MRRDSPAACSGDMYSGVPTIMPCSVNSEPTASLRSVARSLDEPAVAALWARSCEDFSGGILQVPGPVRLEIDKVVAEAGTLAVFNALAVGYARVPEALEKIVFGYPEEGQADADLEARRFLA